MSIVVALLGFNLLILVHELGHYLLARMVGIEAEVFSVGFGPAVIRIHGKRTLFQFALIPIGGYVRLAGMGREDEPEGRTAERHHRHRRYDEASLWERALVVSAGPLFNFVFAIMAYTWLFGSFNAVAFEWKREATTVVKEVSGPALDAGLKAYDVIETINGQEVRSFAELKRLVGQNGHDKMTIVIARGPEAKAPPTRAIETQFDGLILLWPDPPEDWERITVSIDAQRTDRGYRLGVAPAFARFGATGMLSALHLGLEETWVVTQTVFDALGRWFRGSEDAEVASVVKITEIGADTVKMGSEWFLSLLAILSVNLGLLNLLPFPALDGGRLFFVLMEAVSRRPVPRQIELIVHGVGMLILLGFMAVVMFREIAEKF